MPPLEKNFRNLLERTIKTARDVAEAAARSALDQLGVAEPAPFAHLTESERDLRRKLRIHGRQLGDTLNGGRVQTMDRLIEEVAYEHWHRMLFARFLAENNLLMYPDPDDPVAITLEECEELAVEEDAANGWELAARFAARMLPQIFRLDSPVFQLALPPEHQQKLEGLVADLPNEVFTASDSLGWVYQFWQAKRKDEVNAAEVKIGARELPAVTQLFTEPYMVSFLLDNSLGAWWAARRLTEADLQNASNEEELRRKAAIPGVPLDYLRFVQQEDSSWTPAAGTFDGWPTQLADLKTLDPCCGSGHFLVAAFLMLVPMRMERDGLSAKEAVDAVLRENIHGLELDQRCVELAVFALALTAWKYQGAGAYRVLPELNVACSGLSISAKKEEWLALAGEKTNMRIALEELYKQFRDAPVLGSLINPEASLGKSSLFALKWEEVAPRLTKALSSEKDDAFSEMGVVAKGLSRVAESLTKKYSLIITNVPYLAKGKQGETLSQFAAEHYPDSSQDLATVFYERIFELLSENGVSGLVMPQNWLYQTSYKELRKKVLNGRYINTITALGAGAFDGINGWVVNIQLILSEKKAIKNKKQYVATDVSSENEAKGKAYLLTKQNVAFIDYAQQLNLNDFRIATIAVGSSSRLEAVADFANGIQTGDLIRFSKKIWEIAQITDRYQLLQSTVSKTLPFAGRQAIVEWGSEDVLLEKSPNAVIRGKPAWNKLGVAVSAMGELNCSLYNGDLYDDNTVVVYASPELMPSIWSYLSFEQYAVDVRKITKALKVRRQLIEVPFNLERWNKVAEEKYPNGLPKPYTDDPTQWIFHGHPCGSVVWDEEQKWTTHGPLRGDDTVLQVAVARLIGYRWPAELDANMDLADEQRELVKHCEALLPYADDDGIVCIPPVRGEASASDRLLNLLAAAYGDAWSNDTLAALLKNVDHAGKTLENWLREKFFTQHCKLFQHRPFIWHIWDGLRDGFAALVNYHKLDAKLLETLIYTYLGDWISRQKQDIASGVDGAQERLAAAEGLKKKLELILEGEAPYDIFVRWKPIEKQPIGWDPDLNDGVRLNIRPFMTVPDVRKKGAGVLRDKPNIKWNKDRGKDVESAPWYHVFKGDRINDYHLTLAEKRSAQEVKESLS